MESGQKGWIRLSVSLLGWKGKNVKAEGITCERQGLAWHVKVGQGVWHPKKSKNGETAQRYSACLAHGQHQFYPCCCKWLLKHHI